MLRDDAINKGLIKPTKEDRERRGEAPPKPGPKPKVEEKAPSGRNNITHK
jgi:hypothetical protein